MAPVGKAQAQPPVDVCSSVAGKSVAGVKAQDSAIFPTDRSKCEVQNGSYTGWTMGKTVLVPYQHK